MVHDTKRIEGYSRLHGINAGAICRAFESIPKQHSADGDGEGRPSYHAGDGAPHPVCGAGGGR